METSDRLPLVYKFKGKEIKHVDWAETVHSIQSTVKKLQAERKKEDRGQQLTVKIPKLNF